MYGLPRETDLSAFVGCRLQIVSVGLFQLDLGFDGLRNIGISVEGAYTVLRPGGVATRYDSAPAGSGELIALLDAEVEGIAVEDPGAVVINFADGSVVTVHDSEAAHESYQIHIGTRLVVV